MWTVVFEESGGYDSLFGAWVLTNGIHTIKVDLAGYGQTGGDDYEFKSEDAERDARWICAALNDHEAR